MKHSRTLRMRDFSSQNRKVTIWLAQSIHLYNFTIIRLDHLYRNITIEHRGTCRVYNQLYRIDV